MQFKQHGLKKRVYKLLMMVLGLLLPQSGWALGGEPSGDPPLTSVGLVAEGYGYNTVIFSDDGGSNQAALPTRRSQPAVPAPRAKVGSICCSKPVATRTRPAASPAST
jgi:hypothetical protein